MRKLTYNEIAQRRLSPEAIKSARRMPVTVLLENVRSLYNVGSIFRTSDGAMVERLLLCGYTPKPPRKEIEKTALGATMSVPWESYRDPLEAIKILKDTGYTICCLELTDVSIPYDALPPNSFPLCLVLGNELTGVSPSVIERCDLALEIPMNGIKQSLNVAVAYGIAIFEIRRLWQQHSTIQRSNASVK